MEQDNTYDENDSWASNSKNICQTNRHTTKEQLMDSGTSSLGKCVNIDSSRFWLSVMLSLLNLLRRLFSYFFPLQAFWHTCYELPQKISKKIFQFKHECWWCCQGLHRCICLTHRKRFSEKQEKQDRLISNEACSSHAGDFLRGIFGKAIDMMSCLTAGFHPQMNF